MAIAAMDSAMQRRVGRAGRALRTLRVQVSLALLVGAAACAWVASDSSGEELAGAYREASAEVLLAVGRGFEQELRRAPADADELEQMTEALDERQRGLARASVVGSRDGRLVRLASTDASLVDSDFRAARGTGLSEVAQGEVNDGDRHLLTLTMPVVGGPPGVRGLELAYDLSPHDAAVASRSRRFALILTGLLLAFTAFTALVLGRGIFRPLHRLRVVTQRIKDGELGARLDWTRGDELGLLARDFDAMAGELEEKHRRLESLALEDPLTGLANHRQFQQILAHEIELAQDSGTSVGLVVLDIDHFKRLNDARGHPFGDDVLRSVGARLSDAMRGIGYAARLGGDEFAVVLPNTDGQRALALCEAARAAIASLDLYGYELTCSAGIACYPSDARTGPALVQLADGSLYWSKTSGRGQARLYDPEHVLVVTEEQRAEFGSLLEAPNAITPVFQPIVDLRSGEVAGYEALARFAGRSERPPSWWFAQAHRFGLGARLEAAALRAALAAPDRPPGTYLSVNVSPSALLSPEVREVVSGDLTSCVIEITEHEQVADDAALQSALATARERGARVAVDDAGAGYAGLQQVMRMGAELIKLDRALIQGIHLDRAKLALVESFVSFASSTGAELCAEGIESLEELRTLADLGVGYGQGFGLARPGPPWPTIAAEAAATCRAAAGDRAGVISLAGRRSSAGLAGAR